MLKEIKETTKYINSHIQYQPDNGIILGTGLGALVNDLEIDVVLHYEDIPNFPVSTVEGHKGKLIFGTLGNKRVVVMQGRFHYYEGYTLREVTFPVRVMKYLGIKNLFISNAAGGLNPDYNISDLMIIRDHINLLTENPLRGVNNIELGPRFPDMSQPYDRKMIDMAIQIAKKIDVQIHSGVYAVVSGPNLETEAEYRYLRIIGADAVGMSTVPENIVARHMGIPCFAISVITDMGIPGQIEEVSVAKILEAAAVAEPGMTRVIEGLLLEI